MIKTNRNHNTLYIFIILLLIVGCSSQEEKEQKNMYEEASEYVEQAKSLDINEYNKKYEYYNKSLELINSLIKKDNSSKLATKISTNNKNIFDISYAELKSVTAKLKSGESIIDCAQFVANQISRKNKDRKDALLIAISALQHGNKIIDSESDIDVTSTLTDKLLSKMKDDVKSFNHLLEVVEVYINKGDFRQAADILDKMTAILHPKEEDTWFEYTPPDSNKLLKMAKLYSKINMPNKSTKLLIFTYNNERETKPKYNNYYSKVKLLCSLANELFLNNEPKLADKVLTYCWFLTSKNYGMFDDKEGGKRTDLFTLIFRTYMRYSQPDKANNVIKKSISEFDSVLQDEKINKFTFLCRIAEEYNELGFHPQALDTLKSAESMLAKIENDPYHSSKKRYSPPLYHLSLAYAKNGQVDHAFDLALQMKDGFNKSSVFEKIAGYYANNNYKKSLKIASSTAKYSDYNTTTIYEITGSLIDGKNHELAFKTLNLIKWQSVSTIYLDKHTDLIHRITELSVAKNNLNLAKKCYNLNLKILDNVSTNDKIYAWQLASELVKAAKIFTDLNGNMGDNRPVIFHNIVNQWRQPVTHTASSSNRRNGKNFPDRDQVFNTLRDDINNSNRSWSDKQKAKVKLHDDMYKE